MPKKVVLEVVEAFGGGVFSMLNDFCNELNNEYDIVIAYSFRKQTPSNFKELFNNNIKFIEVKNFTRSINLIKDLKALIELKNIIKKIKPDIIHLHSSKAGVLGRIAANGNKYKMFYNPHGFAFLKEDDSKLKRFIYKMIERIMAFYNPKCKIIGCSEGEYLEAKKLSKNSVCINNAINVNELKETIKNFEQYTVDLKKLKICTVGRIGYQKNPKMFNKIAELLPENQFTWIGDGELADQLTSSNIKITGWKNREEVLEELNKNDVFILTSLWEGLPITLLEAGFMRKLCIVSDVIGNRDVIKNKENGFIFDNEKDVKKIIEMLNEEKYKEYVNCLYKEINEKYNINVMVENYKKIYRG